MKILSRRGHEMIFTKGSRKLVGRLLASAKSVRPDADAVFYFKSLMIFMEIKPSLKSINIKKKLRNLIHKENNCNFVEFL